jgi:phage tail protein X
LSLALVMVSGDGAAFPYVVSRGETLGQIAERVYGRIELERVLVAANALDARGRVAAVPGMRLELPAVSHHTVELGQSWAGIAERWLGNAKRGDVLARMNGSQPWLAPEVGAIVVMPYNLRYVAAHGDTTESVAYRFLGRRDEAWLVAHYNGLERARLEPGEVLLVPLLDLPLTEDGKRLALQADERLRGEAARAEHEAQRRAAEELPRLAADVRRGRYVEAVARGAALVERGGLSRRERAQVERALTEAFVALDAPGLAADACAAWRRSSDEALDPVEHSPKILAACVIAAPRHGPSAGPSAAAAPEGSGAPR